MNESWYWIKQRPHFIAEFLSEYYNIDVFCEKRYTKLVNNKIPGNLKITEIYKLPFAHNPVIKRTNKILHSKILFPKYFKNINDKYDIIWLSNPNHFNHIQKFINRDKIVIYDCMDDILEFEGSKKNTKIYNHWFESEKKLFLRSDLIFCSSEFLKNKLIQRYGNKENIKVINNAIYIESYSDDDLPYEIDNVLNQNQKKLVYVGSISEWFDFEILIKTLEKFNELSIILIGPKDVEIPVHKNLFHFDSIEHKHVLKVMQKADALIMPFKITELVKSVNPVKLYEYVYSCVPAIVVNYGEAEHFSDFVYLYDKYDEFITLVSNILNDSLPLKKDKQDYKNFGLANTWEKRIEDIKLSMENILNKSKD